METNFAKQLAARDASTKDAQKRFKSSAAPKGTKLAAGYHDRTQDRIDDDHDDRAQRIKALEEQMKLEQIDRETFEALRDEITGGDIGATHLVKGLDRRLLDRVRRGEDVMSEKAPVKVEDTQDSAGDEDAGLDAVEAADVAPVVREQVIKKGEFAAPPPVAGGKRKRDAILAELKAARRAAAEAIAAAQPELGSHFRKIGQEPRIEVDEKGREILITLGADGKVKRKVRKMRTGVERTDHQPDLLEVDRTAKPMGIAGSELPELTQAKPLDDQDGDDIFEGVGADYDPLAGLLDEDGDGSAGAETKNSEEQGKARVSQTALNLGSGSRGYFDDVEQAPDLFDKPDSSALMATLQRASAIAAKAENGEGDGTTAEEKERLKRRAAMVANRDRDLDDIDMGFGSSRFDDAEEAEDDGRTKLSRWKGTVNAEDDEADEHGIRSGKQRKRGPKKKKGNKDSAADVLKLMETRQSK